jgi:tRNA pseudouridine13 synthase
MLAKRDLSETTESIGKNLKITYIGQVESPLRLGSHYSNFFRLTLRRMNQSTLELLKSKIPLLQSGAPIPNYFDSQKFGYLKGPDGFFGGKYLNSDYENALKLVIARRNRKERAISKEVHTFIQDHWMDWGKSSAFLAEHPFENYLKLTQYLEAHPEDYHGAIKLFTPDSLKLKITSLQAYLWNEYLKELYEQTFTASELASVKYHVGALFFANDLENSIDKLNSSQALSEFTKGLDLSSRTLPLPSMEVVGHHREKYNVLLKRDFGIDDLSEFEKFSELGYRTNAHERKLFFKPINLQLEGEGEDEEIQREKNRYCTLTFELPPGSYATIMIKSMLLA